MNYIQLLNFAYKRLLNKPYENEVTLTEQNPPLEYCQPVELLGQLKRSLDLKILKGLLSDRLIASNFAAL